MAINDGSANALPGTPQDPHLLDIYGANRAPFKVAGVDYYVGVPQGLALKNPATISMAGVNINTSTKAVTITGNNVTLDGYDFSGWSVVTTAANTSLIHSNFNGTNPGGTQTSVISGTLTASNLYVGYSTIDGLTGGGHAEFLVEMEGPGLTVEYSWLKNSNSDIIGRHGNSGGDITIQNNLMEQAGMGGPNTHGDYLQVYGPDINAIHILNNTTIQNGGITQGFFADNTKSAEIAGNTFTGNFNYFVSGSGPNTDPNALVGTFNVHDNYFDPSHTFGFSYPVYGSNDKYPLSLFTHNVNMLTGKLDQDANAPSSPSAPTSPAPTPPAAPTIASFSNDSGATGDHVTNDNTLTLTGTAAANGTVKVFDGATQIGTATANSSGAWSYTTSGLSDGSHNLTAKVTNASGQSSTASAELAVKIDTTAPNAPTIGTSSNNASGGVNLSGTAEANSTVKVFDGTAEIGTATANGSGAWSYATANLTTGSHSFTAKAMDAAGNTGTTSAAAVANIGTGTQPAPSAPKIASFSNDSGLAGDGITNDSTLTLTGTASANSTVKVFDGATQIGTAPVNSSGAWSYTTSALSDGSHGLTATVTNASGQTSTASAALAVKIDTTAPNAPTIGTPSANTSGGANLATLAAANSTMDTNGGVTLTGTAEANSAVKVFDGTTQIGTATANGSGAWSYATANLTTGSHSFTAKAMDAAGNTGTASAAAVVNIAAPTPAPSAPTIAFSSDSGKVGDGITNDSTLTLTGTAAANSTVKVFDGAAQIGDAKANSSGSWDYITSVLTDAVHHLTATATDSAGHASAPSAALDVTIDTHAPVTPKMSVYSEAGSVIGSTTTLDDLVLKGTAEANSTIKVFDGSTEIGIATANGSGTWSFDTGHLDVGSHSFTSKAFDAAGNIGSASASASVGITAPQTNVPTADIEFTNLSKSWWGGVAISGTADPNSAVKLYDGEKALGSVTASSEGTWTYTTKLDLSNTVHSYTAQEVDSTGNVVAKSAGQAILGSNWSNKLASTAGDDLFVGNGGSDTFAFAANFGNDVIRDFDAVGRRHDVLEFSKSDFDSFASVLSHASQVGQDVVISAGSDTLTLKNTKLGALDSHDFHFA